MSENASEELGPNARVWYVLHVKPRTEKRVFERLRTLGVFRYLPLRRKVTRTQRNKVVRELPIFPGYVFTRLNADDRLTVLKTQMVVRTIAVPQPRRMIHQLRQVVHAGRLAAELKPATLYEVGEYVRVKSGPFRGIEGYVQRRGGATTIVLVLEILGQAVETSIEAADLEKVSV